MVSIILSVLGLLISAGLGIAQNVMNANSVDQTNQTNKDISDSTNATNLQIARETNAASVEQANLAYQRSLPIHQVAQMQAAGMSKAAALNKLAGGGTYQAPTLQTATMQSTTMQPKHFDFGSIASAVERMGNIPQNVEQRKMVQEQLNDMKQVQYLREQDEIRKQQEHDLKMDELRFNKEERDNINQFMAVMDDVAYQKNIQPKQGQSYHDYIKELGLQDNEYFKKLTPAGRSAAFERFKTAQDENRAQLGENRSARADIRAGIAAKDAHKIAQQELLDMKSRARDYSSEKDARLKEYKLREVRADVERMLAEDELTFEEYRHDLEITPDGELKFSRKVSEKARRAWKRVADTVGIGVLRDLLSAIKLAG